MNREDLSRIIHGQVFYQGRWMEIERKTELEAQRRTKIEQGLVFYMNEWIPIEDKVIRASTQQVPTMPTQPSQVVYNQQTYNFRNTTDNRTFEEHKHVHVNPESIQNLNACGAQRLSGTASQALPGQRPDQIPPPQGQRRLPDERIPKDEYFLDDEDPR